MCPFGWLRGALKTVDVLDKLPRGQQISAKPMLHEIWMAATKGDATKALEKFAATYQAKYPKAVECLLKYREELLAFYDFPAEHWQHLQRTSNPIESTFATARLRTTKTKGAGSREIMRELVQEAASAVGGSAFGACRFGFSLARP